MTSLLQFTVAITLCLAFDLRADYADPNSEAFYDQLLLSEDAEAQTAWGRHFEHGEGVKQDYDRALRLYCAAAWQDHARAQYHLGWMYANGRGVTRDDALAAAWLRHSVARGDRYAEWLLRHVDDGGQPSPAICRRPDGTELVAVWHDGTTPDRKQIADVVRRLAPRYDLDPALVLAVITVESGFDPSARSPKNAQGLMQLIPQTATRFGVDDAFDPLQNLRGGMAYLRWLLDFFGGDTELALAGYNAGERAVKRYHGIPPYAETQRYVKLVTRIYRRTRQASAT